MTETIPAQILEPEPSDYLAVMARAVFQAGLRWAEIAKHWEAYEAAFDGFDPQKVAQYTEADVDRLMRTAGVLHSARKIRATIANAQALLHVEREFGSIASYLRALSDYSSLAKDLRRRFKFMGEMNVWYFLFRVNRPVPKFEQWVKTIQGEHPRMKEMVQKARAAGTSTEY